MNLFPLILQFEGFPIREASKKLAELQQFKQEDLYNWHDHQKWLIFHFHFQFNSKYRNWVLSQIGHPPKNWYEIPVLRKKDLQFPLSDLLSKGFKISEVFINNTSGSSGHPFFFAKDRFCHAMTWAFILKYYSEHGISYGRSLQARFFGIPLAKNKNLKEKVKDYLSARIRFPVFNLSDNMLNKYMNKFMKYPIHYIYGYCNSLVLFAKYLESIGIVLKHICPTLQLTISTSEVLSDTDRDLLAKNFGVRVINEYGVAELDIIAFEDTDRNWVLNEENLYQEILTQDNNNVDDNEEGRIVITSLFNKAMPFIRYEVGDIGSFGGHTVNGRKTLNSLQGRTNDVAILPSGKKSPGLTFYYISKAFLEEGGGIKEFIIKQLSIDHFLFEYVSDIHLNKKQTDQIKKAMDVYLEPGLSATFKKKDKLERTSAGKLRHFQYLVQ